MYGPVCKYYPSCSEYCQNSIANNGVFLGAAYTFMRLVRCNPWSKGGVDMPRVSTKYRVNKFGFASRKNV
ncbi:MAG: membrane protein insertion efficiency factor YidD [Tropheryma whipplei]|nr:membrane protein insertion efficiency factor YidD [Tropheryma whipplei]MCO8182759.1 membrane protein insertion efficiency factor YidD [Tropheryma whipplei]